MDKKEFLKEIENGLKYLTNEQKQQEIFRISNDLDNGKEIKDINLEIENIYKKYKINVNRKDKIKNNKYLNKLNNFINNIKKNDWKDNLTILRDFIIILLIVSVLKIPFIGLETLLFSIFKNSLTDQMYTVFNFFIELIYIIFAIFMFIRLFTRRFKEEMS